MLFTARLNADGINTTPYGEHLCLPIDQYSPSGMHMRLVHPVLEQLSRDSMEHLAREYGATRVVREVARQAVEALAALHDRDSYHGELRPSNVLLRLHGLDGLEVADLRSMAGQPETTGINIRKDNHPTPNIPFAPSPSCQPHCVVDRHAQTRRLIQGRLADDHDCAAATCTHAKSRVITEPEATAFADLSERLLSYQPEQRVSAQEVLGHNWFHTDYD
ncbi:hypothetical protein Purlil1_13557 [Purpureocillium lilacinum]|uniref:Protein kinase domain-containing protein n=1 Tax=Purpureocillium lilacinum TaxID=33203 RepID=A0ABR0BDS0_PURLI|nr:hypothetical protein Purlil1_13557 [Purpureocillium lilacinum]